MSGERLQEERRICPECHNRYCPAIGNHRYLCPVCGKVWTSHPTSFESGVAATATAFRLHLARIVGAE